MSDVVITDTLTEFVELSNTDSSANYGVTLLAAPSDSKVSVAAVEVTGKTVAVTLSGELTKDTVYTVSIPVKPSDAAHEAVNGQTADAVQNFRTNAKAVLDYNFGETSADQLTYKEYPEIMVARQVTLSYEDNVENEELTVPEETTASVVTDNTDTNYNKAAFTIGEGPEREGYTFLGWNTDKDAMEADDEYEAGENAYLVSDTTLYAVWAENPKVTYEVTGDAPESFTPEVPDTETYAPGTEVAVEEGLTTTETKKENIPGTWEFDGWKTTDAEVGDNVFIMPEKDVAFSGSWTFTPEVYTVTFDAQGHGTAPEAIEDVAYDAKVTEPEPLTEDGWTFGGWFKDAECTDPWSFDTGTVTENITLYAMWEVNGVTVHFEPGGGEGSMEDLTAAYGSDITLTKNTFTRTGYRFTGWKATELTDSVDPLSQMLKAARTVALDGMYDDEDTLSGVTKNVTLTAQWEIIEYTITYDLDGGSAEPSNPENYTVESDEITLISPEKEGYTFMGWTGTDLTGTTKTVTIPTGSVGDRSYTAVWEEIPTPTETPTPTPTETPEPTETPTPTPTETPEPTPTPDAVSYTVSTTSTHVYEIYQILKGDYAELDGKDVLTNVTLGQSGKLPEGKTIQDALDALEAVADEAEFTDRQQLNVIEQYVDLDTDPVQTVTDGTPATGLEGGYYLIMDKENWDGKYHASTTYITLIVKDQAFTPKSLRPTVDKQVSDDEGVKDGTSEENTTNVAERWDTAWGETADHAVNEAFQFRLFATIPASEHIKDYEKYKLVFTDTLSAGVTFDGIASVTIDGNTVSVGENGYVISGIEAGDAGKTWTLTINDIKTAAADLNVDDGAEVVVTYNAHLNENAIKFSASTETAGTEDVNKNSVYLEFSNNPNTGHDSEMGKTEADHVWVFTYELLNTKYADEATEGNELADAKFSILDEDGTALKLIDNKDGTYTVADQTATEGVVTEMTSDADGKFNVIGLDAGTYTLHETASPGGYNTTEDTAVTITATHSETDETDKAALDLGESKMKYDIVDESGSVLPSTGGAGTAMFYIVGAVLILGAGILLVSRRRVNAG